jgi:uncharacterized protein (DUF952 family)
VGQKPGFFQKPGFLKLRRGTAVSVILHITKREEWERAKLAGVYRGDTLESEGFIHCSEPQQVIPVANTWFPGEKGLTLLCIDSQKVGAEIRYEGVGGGERFPHIYGPLNLDAVFQVLDFEPAEDGKFVMPQEISKSA